MKRASCHQPIAFLALLVALTVSFAACATQGGSSFGQPAAGTSQPQPRFLSPNATAAAYRLHLETDPARPVAGRETRLTVTIADGAGQPIADLAPGAGSPPHFVLISANLEDFRRLPEDGSGGGAEGRYIFPVTLPWGGRYTLSVYFLHRGIEVQQTFRLDVDGPWQPSTHWNYSQSRADGDLKGRLLMLPLPQQEMGGAYTIIVTRSGKPVALEPWMGAEAHLTIAEAGVLYPDHLDVRAAADGRVRFSPSFVRPGTYRIFVELMTEGRPRLLTYDVWVSAPPDDESSPGGGMFH